MHTKDKYVYIHLHIQMNMHAYLYIDNNTDTDTDKNTNECIDRNPAYNFEQTSQSCSRSANVICWYNQLGSIESLATNYRKAFNYVWLQAPSRLVRHLGYIYSQNALICQSTYTLHYITYIDEYACTCISCLKIE
jgi:hypothetical protein